MRDRSLTPERQQLLNELNDYHRDRLLHQQEASRRARSGPNLIEAMRAIMQGQPAPMEWEALDPRKGPPPLNSSADEHRLSVPFRYLAARDLSVGSAGAGGYLVASEMQDVVDLLRPWSVTARLGMQIQDGLQGDQLVPRVTGDPTISWLPIESSSLAPSQPSLGQIALTPKTIGGYVVFSRAFMLQANGEAFVRRLLLRALGRAVDQAVLRGTGSNGQLAGLLQTPGLQTETGTSLAHAGTVSMKEKVASANVIDEAIAFLAPPATRKLLEAREKAAGSGFIWQHDQVADRAAFASTLMPAGALLAGDFSNIYLGFWGAGFEVQLDMYTAALFQAGLIGARILVSCDVAVLQPAGFVVASNVT